jgi:hypothetical protein
MNLRAEESISLNEVNLLNFNMLKGYKYDPEIAYYVETLNLEIDQTYTLVMSHAYLVDYLSDLSNLYIAFDENDGSNAFEVYLTNDALNQRAYIEFQSSTGWIDMHHVPVSDQINYEIMLYQGIYQDFSGFVPYLMPSEVMSYGGVLPVDYDALPSLAMIESFVIAKDPYGNTISKTLVSDAFSISDKLPGTYRMVYETVYNHVRKKFYLDVKVFDLTKPILSVESPLNIPLHEKWSLSTIKSYVTVTDNVDTISSSELIVVSDTYSSANLPGTYSVMVKAVDQAGNEESINVTINLIDTVPPIIYGPTSIYLYNTDTPLTSQDIINHFEVTDAIDHSNVTLTLTLDEYMQTTTPGRYLVTYQAKDTQMNTTTLSVYIHVIDHQGPTFETEDDIIERTTAELMTDEDIIAWFIEHTSSQGLSVSSVAILYNEYDGHEDQEGEYYVYVSYLLDEEEITSRILISVDEKPIQPWIWVVTSLVTFTLAGTGLWFIVKHKKP